MDRKDRIETSRPGEPARPEIGPALTFLLAASCGAIVANIYYAQPLLALIAPAVHLSEASAGIVVTLTQLGYGLGMILLAPLGDLTENKRLVLVTVAVSLLALCLAAIADSAPLFLAASLLIGLGSVAVQMMVPIAAHLSPDATRGRVVGNVMSGLLVGIMLARPVSSLIAHAFGWRNVFVFSAVLCVLVLAALAWRLPRFRPAGKTSYFGLLGSMGPLLLNTPTLRRRAAYQALQFGVFTLFWTAVPLELAGPAFGFSQRGIALFAFAGAAGVLAAPLAGRLADKGHSRAATGAGFACVVLGCLLAWVGGAGSLAPLVAGAIILDVGVQTTMVVGQRAIYALGPNSRSRLNAIYLSIFFVGGAIGSALASLAFVRSGWGAVALIGLAASILGLLLFSTEFRGRRKNTAA